MPPTDSDEPVLTIKAGRYRTTRKGQRTIKRSVKGQEIVMKLGVRSSTKKSATDDQEDDFFGERTRVPSLRLGKDNKVMAPSKLPTICGKCTDSKYMCGKQQKCPPNVINQLLA